MPKATFDTWLKGTTAALNGDTLTVLVGNPFAQDWLERRLRSKIERAVAGIAGRPLEITFRSSAKRIETFTVGGNGHRPVRPEVPPATGRSPTDLSPPVPACPGTRVQVAEETEYQAAHYEIWAPADPTVLRIMPDLAEGIGLNESIVLLQLDHWIRHSNNVRDGRRWTYQTLRGMRQKAFKWWSKNTIARAITSLEAQKLIFVTDKYNKNRLNRTHWFALNPEGFQSLTRVELKQAHYEIWAPADPTVLRIMPDLAEEIGLNESIVLLQIAYWIRHSDNARDGRRWTFQSVRDMQRKAFKWWSRETVRRAITSLGAQELIFVTGKYNRHKYDTTHWYALNPDGFTRLRSVELKRATPCP
jgi:DNA-binding PadR family transcriptional regulator